MAERGVRRVIGQKHLLSILDAQYKENKLPKFVIIVGVRGSEKNLVAKELAKQNDMIFIQAQDCKVDTMRTIISEAYRAVVPTIFNITDADDMSVTAKNSILKLTEEPPKFAYIVLTVENKENLLETIVSRGAVYQTDCYSAAQIESYIDTKQVSDRDKSILLEFCRTPGDVDMVLSYNPSEFKDFVLKVRAHVAEVSGANVFKIANNIKLKDSDDGKYDLSTFLRAFCYVCMNENLYNGARVTSQFLTDSFTKSVNRSMLFDSWLLSIREEWRDECC